MDGIVRDDVELFVRRADVIPGIVVNNLDSWVLQNIVVFLLKIRRHDFRDQRLDFADHDSLHAGIQGECSRRHTGAESDDQHRAWFGVIQRGEVSEHPLHLHVARGGRGFNLSAHVEVSRAVLQLRHRDRSIHAFPGIDDRRFEFSKVVRHIREESSIGVESTGQLRRRYYKHAREHHGNSGGNERSKIETFPDQHQKRRYCGNDNQRLLRLLRAITEDEDQTEYGHSGNAANCIRCINSTDQSSGILAG